VREWETKHHYITTFMTINIVSSQVSVSTIQCTSVIVFLLKTIKCITNYCCFQHFALQCVLYSC